MISKSAKEAMRRPLLTEQEEHTYIKRYKESGCKNSQFKILQAFERVIYSATYNYRNCPIDREDLHSEGFIALIQALDNFDETLAYRFFTYAKISINRHLALYIYMNSRTVRNSSSPITRYVFRHHSKLEVEFYKKNPLGSPDECSQYIADKFKCSVAVVRYVQASRHPILSIHESVSSSGDVSDSNQFIDFMKDHSVNIEQDFIEHDFSTKRNALLNHAIATVLNPKEHSIISKRYLSEDGATLSDLRFPSESPNAQPGQLISVERVRQIENKAISKLKAAIHGAN